MLQIALNIFPDLKFSGALLCEVFSFDHSEMQLLDGLAKHTSILVKKKYDSVLCEVSHEHF